MRLSQYFLPILKESPSDAQIISHKLMLRAGMIRQVNSGIYSWLPLGLTVLKKIENIIREELNKSGAVELLMPTLQPAELWKESGRYEDYGKEMLRIKDRHDRDMLYGPTNEEVITDIFRNNVKSYKELPLNLYQIQWKFRDEIRPRFGVMRGREFLMKDGYSFDVDFESSKKTYQTMYETYLKIFKNMGLTAIPVKADTGPIGGELSHEFHILADTGESEVFYDAEFENLMLEKQVDINKLQSLYAMADEMHKTDSCPISKDKLRSRRGIEVGHIFNFGTKYSGSMEAYINDNEGKRILPQMGSYGIGVSRLVGAIIEANHDDSGIIWPEAVAPFKVAIINLKSGDDECDRASLEIYDSLKSHNIEVLYDDTKNSAGQKFATMDLIGIPTQIAIGPRGAKSGIAEIKNRRSGNKEEIAFGDVMKYLIK